MVNNIQFQKYIENSLPKKYVIFGVELRSLSIGHLILMNKHCKMASEVETDITIWDLFIAVAICCRKYKEFIDWFDNIKERDQWLKKWFKYVNKQAKRKDFDLMAKFSLFNAYRSESIQIPMFFVEEEQNETNKSGSHWIQNVISTLVTQGRFTNEEIYDVPIGLALNEYFKILENNGIITFMQDWEIQASQATENTK